MKELIRDFISIIPKLKIVQKPRFKPNGISVLIPVFNEEKTIRSCILSAMEIANEIIVIDCSTDNTSLIIKRLKDSYPKIRYIRFDCDNDFNSFAIQLNIGLSLVKYKWVFRLNSDMICKPEVINWKNKLDELDKNKFYVIDVSHIKLNGDIYHQPKGNEFSGLEGLIFTWCNSLKWVLKPSDVEKVIGNNFFGYRFPLYYKQIRFKEDYLYHLTIKSAKRLLYRKYWTDYLRLNPNNFKSLDHYVSFRVKEEYNTNIEDAIKIFEKSMYNDLVPYDSNRFGELPYLVQICSI